MNKKNIIQLAVVVVCFSASAIVIYNNFIKKAPIPAELVAGSGSVKVEQPILPNGSGFDLSVIEKSGLRFNLLDYPKLNFPADVGVEEGQVLRPIQSANAQ